MINRVTSRTPVSALTGSMQSGSMAMTILNLAVAVIGFMAGWLSSEGEIQ